jgi:hypothetical protein
MKTKYLIEVIDFSPNGTNEVNILKENEGVLEHVETIPDALFGVDVTQYDSYCDYTASCFVDLETALKHIAVSPMSDGSETIKILKKYF